MGDVAMTTSEQDKLEAMIDTYGLFAVLDALSGICGGKAEHIQSNWQDNHLAKAWERAEKACDSAASKILDLSL